MNRPIRTIDPTGSVTQLEYDLLGRVVAVTDPTGVRTTRGYDEVGRPVSLQLGNLEAAKRTVVYDDPADPSPNDYHEEVRDPNGNLAIYRLDALGRVFRIEDAASGITAMEYDLRGNLTQLTDAALGVSLFDYDALSRVVSEDYPYAGPRATKYDETGNPVRITKSDGCKIDMHYDRMGRLLRQHSGATCSGVGPIDDHFGYDARGNLVAAKNVHVGLIREYDVLDRLVREIDARFGTAMAYRYDDASRLIAKIYPDGSVLNVSYDPSGRPIGITDPFSDTTRYVYDAAGRRIETQSAAAALSTQFAYEKGTGRLASAVSTRANGTQAVVRGYPAYDPAGNRQRITEGPSALQTVYSYDALQRLESVDPPAAGSDDATYYAYDAVGNRLKAGHQQGGVFVAPFTTYEYPVNPTTHRLGAVRDADDNLIENFAFWSPNGTPGSWLRQGEPSLRLLTWDALDRLVGIYFGYSASYVYDPLGRRIKKTEAGVTTLYQYDGLDIVAEYSSASVLQATYVFGPGIDEPIKVRRGTTVASYHADGLGSILAVAPTAGAGSDLATYTYGPFGEPGVTSETIPNPYTYTGRERDGSGLYYYRARYYLAEVGRFLTPDPMGLRGGINPYAYVGSNPINFTDPFGLYSKNTFSNLASPLSGGSQGVYQTQVTYGYTDTPLGVSNHVVLGRHPKPAIDRHLKTGQRRGGPGR